MSIFNISLIMGTESTQVIISQAKMISCGNWQFTSDRVDESASMVLLTLGLN